MRNILKSGAETLQIPLSEEALDAFEKYDRFLRKKNAVMNLTAISQPEEVARLHFLDSLAIIPLCPLEGKRVIDIGSGAGFPGVPVKLALPSVELTLLDAQQKRVNFLQELSAAVGAHFSAVHARAEEAAAMPEYRDGFDAAVSRAVARLNMLCELCMPFVKPGGYFIAMKSRESDQEILEAESAIKKLSGEIGEIKDYIIPGTDTPRRAVVIKKLAPTPEKYPRRFAKIQKDPL